MKRLRRLAIVVVAAVCALIAVDCGKSHHGSSLTVRGTVIDPYAGSPTAGVTVWIPGQASAPVVTDSTGSFVFAGIRRPYDLVLVAGTTGATVYQGATASRPQAEVVGGNLAFTHVGYIQGTISGSVFPLGANSHVLFAVGKPVNDGTGNVDPVTGAYAFSGGWTGAATRTISVAALQYDDTNGDPSIAGHFGGFAQGKTTVSDGQTATMNLTLDPSAVSTGHLPFVVTRSGYSYLARAMGLQATAGDPYDFPYLFGYSTVSTRGTIAIPMTTPAVPVWLQMFAQDAGGRYFVVQKAPTDLSTMTVDFPPTLAVSAPAGGSTVDFAQPFTLTGSEPQSVNVFNWYAGTASIVVVSASPSVTFPDLSAEGAALDTSGTIGFFGYTWGPATSVDDALAHGLDVEAAPRRDAYTTAINVHVHH